MYNLKQETAYLLSQIQFRKKNSPDLVVGARERGGGGREGGGDRGRYF